VISIIVIIRLDAKVTENTFDGDLKNHML